jgi:hypothetical protein
MITMMIQVMIILIEIARKKMMMKIQEIMKTSLAAMMNIH